MPLLEVRDIVVRFGGVTAVAGVSFDVAEGQICGLIGPNGAGKTTLLRLLLGQIEPDSGSLRLAKNLDITYLDQTRATLSPENTLWNTLAPLGGDQIIVRGYPKHVAAYAKDNEKLIILGGSVGTTALDASGVKQLATLPSLNELRGKIVGLLVAPATKIAGIVQAPAGQLARVIGAYSKKDAA